MFTDSRTFKMGKIGDRGRHEGRRPERNLEGQIVPNLHRKTKGQVEQGRTEAGTSKERRTEIGAS